MEEVYSLFAEQCAIISVQLIDSGTNVCGNVVIAKGFTPAVATVGNYRVLYLKKN